MNDVKEIVECDNPVDANQYLKLGWQLIRAFSANVPGRYVLGWTKSQPAPHPNRLAAQATLAFLDEEIAKEKAKLAELQAKRDKAAEDK